MTTTATATEQATAAGRAAYLNNRPAAPAADPTVLTLIAGLPVGGGGAGIFRAFTAGFQQEADAAADRVLAD